MPRSLRVGTSTCQSPRVQHVKKIGIRKTGIPKSGFPEFWKSGCPEFRIRRILEPRKSGIPVCQTFGNQTFLNFRISNIGIHFRHRFSETSRQARGRHLTPELHEAAKCSQLCESTRLTHDWSILQPDGTICASLSSGNLVRHGNDITLHRQPCKVLSSFFRSVFAAQWDTSRTPTSIRKTKATPH